MQTLSHLNSAPNFVWIDAYGEAVMANKTSAGTMDSCGSTFTVPLTRLIPVAKYQLACTS